MVLSQPKLVGEGEERPEGVGGTASVKQNEQRRGLLVVQFERRERAFGGAIRTEKEGFRQCSCACEKARKTSARGFHELRPQRERERERRVWVRE